MASCFFLRSRVRAVMWMLCWETWTPLIWHLRLAKKGIREYNFQGSRWREELMRELQSQGSSWSHPFTALSRKDAPRDLSRSATCRAQLSAFLSAWNSDSYKRMATNWHQTTAHGVIGPSKRRGHGPRKRSLGKQVSIFFKWRVLFRLVQLSLNSPHPLRHIFFWLTDPFI